MLFMLFYTSQIFFKILIARCNYDSTIHKYIDIKLYITLNVCAQFHLNLSVRVAIISSQMRSANLA